MDNKGGFYVTDIGGRIYRSSLMNAASENSTEMLELAFLVLGMKQHSLPMGSVFRRLTPAAQMVSQVRYNARIVIRFIVYAVSFMWSDCRGPALEKARP